jgi:hypothetical protein
MLETLYNLVDGADSGTLAAKFPPAPRKTSSADENRLMWGRHMPNIYYWCVV